MLALLFLLLSPLSADAKRVALLIGNQTYAHERALRNPVNDAELLGKVLREDLKFDEVRVLRNLNLVAMDRELEAFSQRARGATVALLYYSGHGMTSAERVTFLLPVDARTGASDGLRLERQAVSAQDIRRQLADAGAQTTLMILDACRDGPGAGKSGTKGLSRVGGGNGFLVAYATEEGKIAEDGSGANSPYAAALAQAWRQPQKTILEQFDFVYDEVTRRYPGQRPDREGNLRANARISPFAPVTPENRNAVEDAAWALCQSGATRVPCDDYLGGWPAGRFVALARTRIRDLVAAGQPLSEPARPAALGTAGDAQAVSAALAQRFNVVVKSISPAVLGLWGVDTDKQTIYADSKAEHVFEGRIIDARARKELAQPRQAELAAAPRRVPGQLPTPASVTERFVQRLQQRPASVRAAPWGLWEVVLGREVYYVDDNVELLFDGTLINTATRQDISRDTRDALMRIDVSKLPLDKALKTVQGRGSRTLVVFADPNCGYCRQLEQMLLSLEDVTIYTFLYPILGPDSVEKSRAIWCASDRQATWRGWMLQRRPPPAAPAACTDPAREVLAVGQQWGVNGTPAMVLADGKRIPGAVSLDKLNESLRAVSPGMPAPRAAQ